MPRKADNAFIINNHLTCDDIFGAQDERLQSLFPASGENFKTDARDHFLMYCLGTKDMSIDQITSLSPEEKHELGNEFLRQVWEHPVFGRMASELPDARKKIKTNTNWYGTMYKKALNKLMTEAVPMPTEKDFADEKSIRTFMEGKFGFVSTIAHHFTDALPETLGNDDRTVSPMNPTGQNTRANFDQKLTYDASYSRCQKMFSNIKAYEQVCEKAMEGSLQERAYYKLMGEADTVNFTDNPKQVYRKTNNTQVANRVEKASKYDWNTHMTMALSDDDCRKILSTPLSEIQKNDPDLYMKTVACFKVENAAPGLRLRYRKVEDQSLTEENAGKYGLTEPGDREFLQSLFAARYNSEGIVSDEAEKAIKDFCAADKSTATLRRNALRELNNSLYRPWNYSGGTFPGKEAARKAMSKEFDRLKPLVSAENTKQCEKGLDYINFNDFLPNGFPQDDITLRKMQQSGIPGPYEGPKMNALLLSYLISKEGMTLDRIADLPDEQKIKMGKYFVDAITSHPIDRSAEISPNERARNYRWLAGLYRDTLANLAKEDGMTFPADENALDSPEKAAALKGSRLYLTGVIASQLLPLVTPKMESNHELWSHDGFCFSSPDSFEEAFAGNGSPDALINNLATLSAYSQAIDSPEKAAAAGKTLLPIVSGKPLGEMLNDPSMARGRTAEAFLRGGADAVREEYRIHMANLTDVFHYINENMFSRLAETAAGKRDAQNNFDPTKLSAEDLSACEAGFDDAFKRLYQQEKAYLNTRENPSITANFRIGDKSAWDSARERFGKPENELNPEEKKTVEQMAKALIINTWLFNPNGIDYQPAVPSAPGAELPEDIAVPFHLKQENNMENVFVQEEAARQKAIRDEQERIRRENEERERVQRENEERERQRLAEQAREQENERKRGPHREPLRQRAAAINGNVNRQVLDLPMNSGFRLNEMTEINPAITVSNQLPAINEEFDRIFGDFVLQQHRLRNGNRPMTPEDEADIIGNCFKIKNEKAFDKSEETVRSIAEERCSSVNKDYGLNTVPTDYYKTAVIHALARDYCTLNYYPMVKETGSNEWIQDDKAITFKTAGKQPAPRQANAGNQGPQINDLPPFRQNLQNNAQNPQVQAQPPARNGKSYERYLDLHTGTVKLSELTTRKKLLENGAKVMGVLSVKNVDPNNARLNKLVSNVHTVSPTARRLCNLDYIPDNQLRDIMRSPQNAASFFKQAPELFYGVHPDNWAKYKSDMKKIYDSMLSGEGRTPAYNNLRNKIKAVADIEIPENLSEEQLKQVGQKIAHKTGDLMIAIEDYTKGKEKIRWKDYGNLAFSQAIDALAVIKNNRKNNSLDSRIDAKISEINHVRGVTQGPKFIDINDFGAEKAETRRATYNQAHPEHAPRQVQQGPMV